MILMDGKALAKEIRQWLAEYNRKHGLTPCLAIIRVGEDPASVVYVRNKVKAAKECGIRTILCCLPETASQADLEAEIVGLNADPAVDAILLQLPLPAHLDEHSAIRLIDPKKDADGLHPQNLGVLLSGGEGIFPCTPVGCMALLNRYHVPLSGRHAVVVGRSTIVGKPMALLLLRADCTVTVCHSHTRNLREILRTADIVVSAVGKPRFITVDMIKPGAAVVDVGINRLPDGSICGDVDFDSVSRVAGWLTPVPGGVGPMTVAELMDRMVAIDVTKQREFKERWLDYDPLYG